MMSTTFHRLVKPSSPWRMNWEYDHTGVDATSSVLLLLKADLVMATLSWMTHIQAFRSFATSKVLSTLHWTAKRNWTQMSKSHIPEKEPWL